MSILHTWGQSLTFHPHIHCIVLGGGLIKDLKFKKANKLEFSGHSLHYRNSYAFQEFINLLYSKEWIPHIKETFNGATHVIEYLGRYTHRIAISNAKIISVKPDGIVFSIKNYKNK